MNEYIRPMGVERNHYSDDERKKIDTFAKKSLHLTKEQIEEILNEAFDEQSIKRGMVEGIEQLTKTSPTQVKIERPRESFDIEEHLHSLHEDGKPTIPGIDPKTIF